MIKYDICAGRWMHRERRARMSVLYGITFAASLLMLAFYFQTDLVAFLPLLIPVEKCGHIESMPVITAEI